MTTIYLAQKKVGVDKYIQDVKYEEKIIKILAIHCQHMDVTSASGLLLPQVYFRTQSVHLLFNNKSGQKNVKATILKRK